MISSSGADGKVCAVVFLTQSPLSVNSLFRYLALVQIAVA